MKNRMLLLKENFYKMVGAKDIYDAVSTIGVFIIMGIITYIVTSGFSLTPLPH